jgi:hypothetical protein
LLGVAALLPSGVYVSVRYLVIAKGSAFGPLKWGERGGGHGVHADEGAERDRGSPVVALEIG